ncbi:hypothetical protein FRC11_013121 [Ceratobasidium sp. 423]|nr:hypothetical protein FRC11_013121 [Ceratobasidium sp. 423]
MDYSGEPERWELLHKYQEAMNVSLERAQGCSLDIAAVLELGRAAFCTVARFDSLEHNLSQIRTINIVADSPIYIRLLMDILVQGPIEPSSLLELSLCHKQDKEDPFYRMISTPGPFDHVYLRESSELILFNEILESLTVLRLSGVYIHWDMLTFSNRLTKLRLQDINFDTDHTMIHLLYHALTSATGLRDLEIISTETCYDLSTTSSPTRIPMISFPNLESLLVDDLYCNTLFFLLRAIKSRSHRLTLRLTRNSLCVKLPRESRPGVVKHRLLRKALEHVPVHKLCIHAALHPTIKKLGKLIKSVPTLDTLFLDEAEFTAEYCNALGRQEIQENELQSSPFPSFQYLHFSRATIKDIAAFKSMLTSHSSSMRQITVGGLVYTSTLPDSEAHYLGEDRDKDKEFISQLEKIVPEVILTSVKYIPLEFQHDRWQLW